MNTIFVNENQLKLFVWISLFSAFIFDAVHVFVSYYQFDFLYLLSPLASFSSLPRFIAWLIALIDFVVFVFSSSKRNLKFSIGLVLFFLFVNLNLQPTLNDGIGYLIYIVKLTLPLLMYRLISRFDNIFLLAKVCLVYFTVNCLVSVLGALFQIEMFRVYGGLRFGYYGLMVAANQLSFVFITMLAMLLTMKEYIPRIGFYIMYSLFLLAGVSLGTKALWGMLLVFFAISYFDGRVNRRYLFSIFGIGAFWLLFFMLNYEGFKHFQSLLEQQGWIFTITSKRNELVSNVFFQNLKVFNFWNYLFGGINLKNGFVEMDVLDMVLAIGVVGLILFGYVNRIILFSFPLKKVLTIGFVIIYLMVGIFAGHAFVNALNFIFLPVVCVLMKKESKIKRI